MGMSLPLLFLLLLLSSHLLPPPPSAAADFVFNGFDRANQLSLYGDAAVEAGYPSLSLTNPSDFSIGRAFYKTKVATRAPSTRAAAGRVLPFHASFIISIASIRGVLPGHGIAFLFSPSPGIHGATAAQHLGLFNRTTDGDPTNRVFAVEFDLFQNQEFSDINANHVGVDLCSLTSIDAKAAGYWKDDSSPPSSSFVDLKLNDGTNYQAWVDYVDGLLNVTMAPASLRKKPSRPLISTNLDLSAVFLDEMYVGFCAATGKLIERHRILGWSFSNYNSSLSDALITSKLPNFIPQERGRKLRKGAVAGIAVAVVVSFAIISESLYVFWRHKRRKRRGGNGGDGEEEDVPDDWELEYWPHRIRYRDIFNATDGFSDQNLIGSGGNGKVYRGVLTGSQVAVKLFLQNTGEEVKQFVAEISSLGRLKHRNLVGLKGWCRWRKEEDNLLLILVYDYMGNGSLDRWLFPSDGRPVLNWAVRVKVLKDVAAGVLYLHDGWEARVLHRDIKASNVLLDGSMNGRLGDFGLARTHLPGCSLTTSRVVGSVGYMPPEVVISGRATAASDVYCFGVLLLETVCGRRSVEEGCPPLVEWAWSLAELQALPEAVDSRLLDGSFDEQEAMWLLELGLMCTIVDPANRPTMRQVARALERQPQPQGKESGEPPDGPGNKREAPEASLLDRRLREPEAMAPTTALWMKTQKHRGRYPGGGRVGTAARGQHLTFEELRQSMSCSTSLSASDIIVEGR